MGNYSKTLQIGVGSVTIGLIVVAIIIAFQGQSILGFGQQEIKAEFNSVLNVVPNASDVRVNGVAVGRVTAIETGTENTAIAVLGIEPDVELKADASAALRLKSFLGEKYVELNPGSSKSALKGNTLPLEVNEGSADLGSLLSAAGPLLGSLPPEEITQTLSLVGDTVEENGQSISNLIAGMSEGLDNVVQNREELFAVLDQTDRLLETLVASGPTFDRIMRDLESTQNTVKVFLERNDPVLQAIFSDALALRDMVSAREAELTNVMDRTPALLGMTRELLGMLVLNLEEGKHPFPIGLSNFGKPGSEDLRLGQ